MNLNIPKSLVRDRREFSAVDPRGQLTGYSGLLSCGHWSGWLHPASSVWDFPADPLICPQGCGEVRFDVHLIQALRRTVRPCPCECNSGGFCGGCGHAGCGGRR